MGRSKKNPTLEERIEAAQAQVSKLHRPYQDAIEELSRLLDERDKNREDLLLEAIARSKRSYDEIIEFIQSDSNDDEWYTPGLGF